MCAPSTFTIRHAITQNFATARYADACRRRRPIAVTEVALRPHLSYE